MAESPHARFERFTPEERLFHLESLPGALRLPPTVLRMATTELGKMHEISAQDFLFAARVRIHSPQMFSLNQCFGSKNFYVGSGSDFTGYFGSYSDFISNSGIDSVSGPKLTFLTKSNQNFFFIIQKYLTLGLQYCFHLFF